MKTKEKDSINWLMNQEDAIALIKIIPPREFITIEAVTLHINSGTDKEEVLETNSDMVQYKQQKKQILLWISDVNEKHGHKVGVKYIYFRFKR